MKTMVAADEPRRPNTATITGTHLMRGSGIRVQLDPSVAPPGRTAQTSTTMGWIRLG